MSVARGEKRPTRVATHARRRTTSVSAVVPPSSSGGVVESVRPWRVSAEGEAAGESAVRAEARAKELREEQLRDEIRLLDLYATDAATRTAEQWARLRAAGDAQYQLMARAHANPLWTVPPPGPELDELADAEGDAFLASQMAVQRARFDRGLHPQLAVRLAALQGSFNTRDPDPSFLRAIEDGPNATTSNANWNTFKSSSASSRDYDPLHGNPGATPVTRRHSHTHAGHAHTSLVAKSAPGTRAASAHKTRPAPPVRQRSHPHPHPPPPQSDEARDAVSPLPSPRAAARSVRPSAPVPVHGWTGAKTGSGGEFDPIPPLSAASSAVGSGGPLTDRDLLAQVFGDSGGAASSTDTSSAPSPALRSRASSLNAKHASAAGPPSLSVSTFASPSSSSSDRQFSDAEEEETPLFRAQLQVLPVDERTAARAQQHESELDATVGDSASFASEDEEHDDNDDDEASSPPRRPSVTWAQPEAPRVAHHDPDEPASVAVVEEKNALPSAVASVITAAVSRLRRPHTAEPVAQPPPRTSRVLSAATTTDGHGVTGSTNSRASSAVDGRSRPRTSSEGSQSARTRTPRAPSSSHTSSSSTSRGPSANLGSFGYADRAILTRPETVDAFRAGSGSESVDIVARPRAKSDSSGSSSLARHGAGGSGSVRYRSTPEDAAHEALSRKLADACRGGTHTLLDLRVLRREVDLVTNATAHATTGGSDVSQRNNRAAARVALLRQQAAKRRSGEVGAGSGQHDSSGSSGGAHGVGGTTSSVAVVLRDSDSDPLRSSRSPKRAGLDVARVRAPEFGEPPALTHREATSSMFDHVRQGPSFAGGTAASSIDDPTAYIGPGSYHPKDGATRPATTNAVFYGPPRGTDIEKLARFARGAPRGPGAYRVSHAAGDVAVHGHVSLARAAPRGPFDFVGPHADLSNPPPALYEPDGSSSIGSGGGGGGGWRDALRSRHATHGFGQARRFVDPLLGHPDRPPPLRRPERMLALASPRHGPGALHAVLPSRGASSYDPNMEAFLSRHAVPPLDQIARYLTRDELAGTAAGDEDAHDATNHVGGGGGGHTIVTRAMEKDAREMEALLAGALAGTPTNASQANSSGAGTDRKFVPIVMRPINEAEKVVTTPPPPVPSLFVAVSPRSRATSSSTPLPPPDPLSPTSHEQRARAALFVPPAATSATHGSHANDTGDFTRRNRLALVAATPRARRQAAKATATLVHAHRAAVAAKASRLASSKLSRMRAKIAADDEALAARSSGSSHGGLFGDRWMLLAALAARTGFMKRAITFARRMRSEAHRRHIAARTIQRVWRRFHEHRVLIRRRAAILTLNRVFGTFRVRLRIRRKQRAADRLRAFFRNIASADYQPPPVVTRDPSHAGGDSTLTDGDATHLAQMRRRARTQAAVLAKLKLRTGGERTLVGLVRHFKSQVLVVQRAWRAYCLMREYQVDMHVLLWDEIQTAHYRETYSRMHRTRAATVAAVQASSNEPTPASSPPKSAIASKAPSKAPSGTVTPARSPSPPKRRISLDPSPVVDTALPVVPASPTSVSTPTAAAAALAPASPSSAGVARKAKVKPVVLKLDARFTTHEKRQILLDALRQRKLRFIRVKQAYLQQQTKFVSEQSHGLSAARRLLESADLRFSATASARRFSRLHAPPYLPRLMTQRQMVQVMNAASLARKQTRKSRYNAAAASGLAGTHAQAAAAALHLHAPQAHDTPVAGRSVRHLFQRSSKQVGGAAHHEFDLAETRLRENLLRAWAAHLPIPTRLTSAHMDEDEYEEEAAEEPRSSSVGPPIESMHPATDPAASHPTATSA